MLSQNKSFVQIELISSLSAWFRSTAIDSRQQIGDPAVQSCQLGDIGIWNVHAQLFVDPDYKVQKIHRIDIDLIAEISARINGFQINLGRNAVQGTQDDFPDFFFVWCGHSFSGSCNKRSMAIRKRPPRWPS